MKVNCTHSDTIKYYENSGMSVGERLRIIRTYQTCEVYEIEGEFVAMFSTGVKLTSATRYGVCRAEAIDGIYRYLLYAMRYIC